MTTVQPLLTKKTSQLIDNLTFQHVKMNFGKKLMSVFSSAAARPPKTGPRVGGNEAATDQALVKRAKAGDKRSFDLLVLRHQNDILRRISHFIRDPMEAQDVAQETFIKAYRAIGSFRGDSAFYTWLYRIATNAAKNHLLAQSRRPSAGDGVDAMEAEQYAADSKLKEKATPEGLVMAEELKRIIFQTISALPDELREAITLREIKNMSYKEIAIAMDCPVGTVRSRIFRAREAIEQKIGILLN